MGAEKMRALHSEPSIGVSGGGEARFTHRHSILGEGKVGSGVAGGGRESPPDKRLVDLGAGKGLEEPWRGERPRKETKPGRRKEKNQNSVEEAWTT